MGPSSPRVVESIAREGVSIKDIPIYIPPSWHGAQAKNPTKNQRYHIRILEIPQGMVCTSDIVHTLMQLRYEEHNLLELEDVKKELY